MSNVLRRVAGILLAWAAAGAAPGRAQSAPAEPALVPVEGFPIAVADRRETESFVLWLLVPPHATVSQAMPARLELVLRRGATVVERRHMADEALRAVVSTAFTVLPTSPAHSLRRAYARPQHLDLRVELRAIPTAWAVDSVDATLTVHGPDGASRELRRTVAVERYRQRTTLHVPLPGRSLLTQGMFNDDGHGWFTNAYALDFMGLEAHYGPMTGAPDSAGLRQFASFGRTVVAPAAGRVVYVRNDVPDNPPGANAESLFAALPDPVSATAGNAIIIDHENGEYSVLMHLERGSVRVAVGDRVTVRQPIARAGNSGDSFGPHLHYQLQRQPRLFGGDAVPPVFVETGPRPPVRGRFITAPQP